MTATRFVLSSTNPAKAREISEVLEDAGANIELVARPDDVPHVEETGDSLEANARLKAAALAAATGLPAIADDTGLEVDGLDGAPGVRSARYAGPEATDEDNVTRLLAELGERTANDEATRRGRFATVAIARWPDGREVAALGEVEGHIADRPRGSGGFGYDPVFVPDEGGGRTFAEMSPAEKHGLSHRGRAFRTLARGLQIAALADSGEPGPPSGES